MGRIAYPSPEELLPMACAFLLALVLGAAIRSKSHAIHERK